MPRQSPPSQPQHPGKLEPAIWQACAGPSVEIPKPNSMVYYFPQGHFDQASSAPRNLSTHLLAKPFITCSVVSVDFLADPLTDEVFTKMVLQPVGNNFPAESFHTPAAPPPNDDKDNDVVSFAKILTPSDANNGGGFSVPRFCADSVFPKLNFGADPPVQNLSVTDVHGFTWEFRHIYRGTPRRHLLTTGWSTFVNNKKLVAGDSVLFMKSAAGRLFVGIRRTIRSFPERGNCVKLRLIEEEDKEEEEEEDEEKEKRVFKRDGKGKLSAKVVAEAAELAARNMPFEVVYYPKAGWSEFVVKTEVVDAAMRIAWSDGMRVKMSVETDDSSRMTWFQGTVSAVSFQDNGQWCGSPWRMLQNCTLLNKKLILKGYMG
ncbi:auxin response factor 17 isoform X2 [Vigna unguiculata]|uniref:auxin response factor 17 isoform X2 n=1 Tax=Vigna unguiculata TaxID=3917 RepID=UPI0010169202|nr:auxin response factor 17 isoform X2 [Vigna unguiculata]